MDVMPTMKMNDMVKNLTRHGIISDSDEAIEMASKMYNVEKGEPKVEIEDPKKLETDKAQEQIKNLIDKRLQYFLEKNNSMIYKELQELWTKMNQIGPEFENRIHQVRQEVLTVDTQPKIQPQKASEPVQKEPEKPVEHPRSGEFSDSQFSVDKIFYCGDK